MLVSTLLILKLITIIPSPLTPNGNPSFSYANVNERDVINSLVDAGEAFLRLHLANPNNDARSQDERRVRIRYEGSEEVRERVRQGLTEILQDIEEQLTEVVKMCIKDFSDDDDEDDEDDEEGEEGEEGE